ncbi:MAG: hypothetical protein C0410_07075 [Anaerolinea sp.]|nr:hypothetical protein [Anaerolinea sp.]
MKAIHWLRSRQEENELGYWLSFAAYDQKDRSFINKAYLLYLVIFLFIWLMMMLFFFAKYGGMVLSLLNPGQGTATTITIEWVVLACWNLFGLFQSARRSPIVFSETDKALLCQTPISRRMLVLRWLWMPWLKNALPFWLMALVLGFSTAELNFVGADPSNAIFSYVGFGIRALIHIIPIHFSMYIFQWIIGVLRLRKNDQRNWIIYPAVALGLITLALAFFTNSKLKGFSPLNIAMTSDYINGDGSSPLLFGIGIALFLLGILFWLSHHINLNRAAQETSEIELMTTATRYGFTDLVEQHRLQNRLTSKRKISLGRRHKGDAVFLWKNQLQQLRGFSWKQLFPLLTIFSITMGLPLVPGFMSKLLALFFLVMQIGPLLTPRLRSDLACWPILQQLPIRKPKLLIYDLLPNLLLLFVICLLGLGVSAIITHAFAFNFLLVLPGLLATIGFTAAIDIFRKSKSDLLINGNVPTVGTQGVILGLIGTIIPVWVLTTFNNPAGFLLSTSISLAISWVCYKFAIFSFKNIKS